MVKSVEHFFDRALAGNDEIVGGLIDDKVSNKFFHVHQMPTSGHFCFECF